MANEIISCDCGARLRVPNPLPGSSIRCPKCKSVIALPAALELSTKPVISGAGTMCPVCQTTIAEGEACQVCPECDQMHHLECWKEMGGCATYGCAAAPTEDKSSQTVRAPLTAWGDTKECPVCGETIKSIALKCRYCKTEFETVDPQSLKDINRSAKKKEELGQIQQSIVALFVVSLMGCLAPIMALVSLGYVLPRREKISKCGPLYTILAWTSVLLSCVYTVLILLFVVLEKMV